MKVECICEQNCACSVCVVVLGQGHGLMENYDSRISPNFLSQAEQLLWKYDLWSIPGEVQTEPKWVVPKYPECIKFKILIYFSTKLEVQLRTRILKLHFKIRNLESVLLELYLWASCALYGMLSNAPRRLVWWKEKKQIYYFFLGSSRGLSAMVLFWLVGFLVFCCCYCFVVFLYVKTHSSDLPPLFLLWGRCMGQ